MKIEDLFLLADILYNYADIPDEKKEKVKEIINKLQ